ncbi:MAG: PAS domain-containing protein [Bacteriovorax sp.]|nr:PAS domain-containing protein [Bacteriovorax sp.]
MFPFLSANTVTTKLIESIDWNQHELGGAENWPPCLKISLGIVSNSLHPMFIWWGENHIQFYNDEYIKTFGKEKHPMAMGQKGEECWPEIWPVVHPQIKEVLKNKTPNWYKDQKLSVVVEGKFIDTYWSYGYTPILNESGEVQGIMVMCHDTTEGVKAKKSVHKPKHQLNQFMENSPVGISVMSGPKLIYKSINPAFLELLGCGKKSIDLIGKSVREVFPELHGHGFFEILEDVYRTGIPFIGSKHKLSILTPEGEMRDLFINFSYLPRINSRGRITGIISYIYEVTDQVNEQKELEIIANNLKEAILSRDNFLGVASHELNTPITTIKLQTQMHKKYLVKNGISAEEDPKVHRMLDNTLSQINRIARLVEDMLDVARINAGKLAIKKTEADLSMLLEDTLERFSHQLEAAGCTIDMNIEKDIRVNVDAGRIEQVVSNLITNVIKYAPGRPVHVKLIKGMTKIRMTVEDEGKGIAPQNTERIFGRFERASINTDVGGMGLGLYISRQIVLDHGGLIYVDSPPGKGARFNIELPKFRY